MVRFVIFRLIWVYVAAALVAAFLWFDVPGRWVKAHGQRAEAIVDHTWLSSSGGCMVSFNYQAAAGLAPHESEEFPRSMCEELGKRQTIGVRYVIVFGHTWENLEVPGDFHQGL